MLCVDQLLDLATNQHMRTIQLNILYLATNLVYYMQTYAYNTPRSTLNEIRLVLSSLSPIEVSDVWVTWASDPANLPQFASAFDNEDEDEDNGDD